MGHLHMPRASAGKIDLLNDLFVSDTGIPGYPRTTQVDRFGWLLPYIFFFGTYSSIAVGNHRECHKS